jgi:L-amino acid N-acyltransferase
MLIRPAEPRDLKAILAIYNDAVLHTTATYDDQPDTLRRRTAWFYERHRAGYPVFVAEDPAGRVAGWSALNPFRSKPGYRYTAENSVYVAADRRREGCGRALLDALVGEARAMELHAIVAGIDAESEASLRLHEAFGFREVARFREVGFKFGRWLDVVFMELLLT